MKKVSAVSAVRTSVPEMLSIREFARRDGCDESLVRKALKSGRLVAGAGGLLAAELVGSDWRLSNRRSADTSATKVRTPATVRNQMSAPSAPTVSADDLADLATAAGFDVAVVLLPLIPRPVLEPLVDVIVRRLCLVAADLLQEGGVPPPVGLSTWRDLPAFADPSPYMDESAWADAAESAGLPAEASPTIEAARIADRTPLPPLAESEARKEHFLAHLRQLEYEQRIGDVLPASEVERVVGAVLDATRARYLALPTKAAPLLVGLAEPGAVSAILTRLIHETLADLSESTFEVRDGELVRTERRANGHG